MIITTYRCDKCGESENVDIGMLPKETQFLAVKVTYTFLGSLPSAVKEAIMCRDCAVKCGGLPPFTIEDKKIAPTVQPSIEDMIREIVRCELQQAGS
jgi:hypothetical protein